MNILTHIHRIILSAIVLVITFVCTQRMRAQEKKITLADAISSALEKNTQMITSRNTLASQQSRATVARGTLYPSVDASAGWNYRENNSPTVTTPFGSTGGTSSSRTYSADIGASVVLFNGFANYANIEQANAGVASSQNMLERQKQTTTFQTIQLYLDVLRNEQLLRVRQDNLSRSKEQLKRIEESNRLGGVAIADVYRQQVVVSNDELLLIQTQNEFDKAQLELVLYLGMNAAEKYSFADNSIPTNIDSTELSSAGKPQQQFSQLVAQSLAMRADYLSAQHNLSSARLSLSIAQGVRYPTLSANGSYGYGAGKLSELTENSSLSFGLNLSYPMFNNFRTDNAIQQAEIEIRNAEEVLHLKERQVSVEIQKALLDVEAARKSVEVSQTGVRSAIEDRRIAEEKYNLGAGTLLDKLVADANYTAAVNNKVNAVYSYIAAKKQFDYTIGDLK